MHLSEIRSRTNLHFSRFPLIKRHHHHLKVTVSFTLVTILPPYDIRYRFSHHTIIFVQKYHSPCNRNSVFIFPQQTFTPACPVTRSILLYSTLYPVIYWIHPFDIQSVMFLAEQITTDFQKCFSVSVPFFEKYTAIFKQIFLQQFP